MASIKKIVVFCAVCCLLVVNAVFCMPKAMFSVAADSPAQIFTLINTLPETFSNASALYNIQDSEKETYTPFNAESKNYYDGWSFSPVQNDTTGQINAEYNCLDIGTINTEGKSLYLWIYFSNILLQDKYEIFLHSSSNDLTITLFREELHEILAKDDVDFEYGYSWNKLELPLPSGEYRFTSVSFKSSSIDAEGYKNSADLNIYNVYISDSETNYNNAKSKQKYVDFGVLNPTSAVLNTKFLGDKIVLPSSINSALEYAFYGKVDLLSEPTARWKIGVVYNNGEPNYDYDFGDTITFDKKGTYMIFYSCLYGSENIDYVKRLSVSIEEFYGLYFENPSFENLKIGESYILNYSLNPALNIVGDKVLEFNSEYIDAEILEGNKIKVTVKKAGDTSIKLIVNGTRVGKTEASEYSTKASLEIDEVPVDNFYIFEICSYVFLGAVGVAIIVFVVKSFVKARKFNVK